MKNHITNQYYHFTLLLVLLLLMISCGGSNDPDNDNNNEQSYTTFAKSYGGDYNDNIAAFNDIQRENQNKFMIAGNFAQQYYYDHQTIGLERKLGSFDTGALWLAELDTNGNLLSHRGYSNSFLATTPESIRFEKIEFVNDGGYWIAGSQESTASGGKELVVIRVNSNGNEIWNNSFSLITSSDLARLKYPNLGWALNVTDTHISANGELLLSVELYATVNETLGANVFREQKEFNLLFLRISADGDLIWTTPLISRAQKQKEQDEQETTGFYSVSISEAPDSTVIVGADEHLIGLSSSGVKLWQKEQKWKQITASSDGAILIMTDLQSSDGDVYVKRFDTQGNLVKSINVGLHKGYNGFATRCDPTNNNSCQIMGSFGSIADNTLQLIDLDSDVRSPLFDLSPYCDWILNTHYQKLADEYYVLCASFGSSDVSLLSFSPSLALTANAPLILNDRDLIPEQYEFSEMELIYTKGSSSISFVDRWQLNGNGLVSALPSVELSRRSVARSVVTGMTAHTTSTFMLVKVNEVGDPNNVSNSTSQNILNIDTNGDILWQKKWRLKIPEIDIPSASMMNQANDALQVYGFDAETGWGGLLSFSANNGEVSAGVNVVPEEYREEASPAMVANENSSYLANTYKYDRYVRNIWVTRLNATGDIVWQYLYTPASEFTFYSYDAFVLKDMLIDTVGNLYLLGIVSLNSDLLTVTKLNEDGEILWTYDYRIGAPDIRRMFELSAVLSPENEPVIAVTERHSRLPQAQIDAQCGTDNESNHKCISDLNFARTAETGHKNISLIKLDTNGDAVWTKRYGAAYDESVASISAAADGGYVIAGRSDSIGSLGEGLLLRVDASGDIVEGCQFNQAATIVSLVRNENPHTREAYHSVQSTYVPEIEDSNYQQIEMPELVIARSCAGTAVDPTGNTVIAPTPTTGELFMTIIGNGTVTSTPSGISCPDDCTHTFAQEEIVQLKALPEPGWIFDKWSGDIGCTGQVSINTASKGCVAEFKQVSSDSVTLTLVIQGGPGAGQVNSSETLPIMQCINSNEAETTCTAVFSRGTNVHLVAEAFGSKNNVAWIGCPESGGNNCALTMDQNQNVSVVFTELQTHTLSLNVIGSGAMTSLDGLLDCRGKNTGTCTADYVEGSTVIFDYLADAGQTLLSWGGDCAPSFGTQSNILAVDQDLSCSAVFTGPSIGENFLCTRIVNETGSDDPGTVHRSARGRPLNTAPSLQCEYYPSNSQISLIPQPNAGYGFFRWDGFSCFNNMIRDGDNNQAENLIDLPPDTNCSAVFRDDVNRLSVSFGGLFSQIGDRVESVTPTGGSFTLSGYHSCEENCNEPMLTDNGQDIWLRAVPVSTSNNDWAGWEGCDELSADPNGGPQLCRVFFQQAVGEQRSVTVNFTHFRP